VAFEMKQTMQVKGERCAKASLQYGAIPFLVSKKGTLKVVLVTSRGKGEWLFPKGCAERKLSPKQVALNEAFEEAGILGEIGLKRDAEICWRHCNGKMRELLYYPMDVTELLDRWPESKQRERRVVSIPKALRLLKCPHLKQTLIRMTMRLHKVDIAC
jgi:8-oxo-dGTP pyrophosphatase MutT (NUDIX family)